MIRYLFITLLVTSLFSNDVLVTGNEQRRDYDNSINVSFVVPIPYQENISIASNLGLIKYYELKKGTKTLSAIFVNCKEKKGLTFKKFIENDMYAYYKRFTNTSFNKVQLPKKITNKFYSKTLNLESIVYKSENLNEANSLVVFFETVEAFWIISLSAEKTLFNNKEIVNNFLVFLDDIKISIISKS